MDEAILANLQLRSASGDGGGEGWPNGGQLGYPDKFNSLRLCPVENFELGLMLEAYIGPPHHGDKVSAMMREHANGALFLRESGMTVKPSKSKQLGGIISPQAEWNLVVLGEEGLAVEETLCRRGHSPQIKKRELLALKDYLRLALGYNDLTKAEVIALRLWTGPMYSRYALLLRSICKCRCNGQRSPDPELVQYATTIHALNSGIVKLSRLQSEPRTVYRGLQLQGTSLVGVDPSPLAFAVDRATAERYASKGGCGGLLLELNTAHPVEAVAAGALAHGADVSWLSQFPHEKEVLFPALSQVWDAAGQHTDTCASGCMVRPVVVKATGATLEELASITTSL